MSSTAIDCNFDPLSLTKGVTHTPLPPPYPLYPLLISGPAGRCRALAAASHDLDAALQWACTPAPSAPPPALSESGKTRCKCVKAQFYSDMPD